jgi:hypothetical protein
MIEIFETPTDHKSIPRAFIGAQPRGLNSHSSLGLACQHLHALNESELRKLPEEATRGQEERPKANIYSKNYNWTSDALFFVLLSISPG